MQRVAVTGATGFIGLNLVDRLGSQAIPTVCLLRNESNLSHIAAYGPRIARVNLRNTSELAAALQGCDTVIHLASDPSHLSDAGCVPLLDAARKAGLTHFIMVSSVAVHNIAGGLREITERSVIRPDGEYAAFKAAEEMVMADFCDHADRSRLAWTVIRPTTVYGPWDRKSFMFEWIRAASDRPILLPGRLGGRIHLCYVKNLIDLVLMVLSNPASHGETFLAADSYAPTLGEIWTSIEAAVGATVRHTWLPARVVEFAVRAARRLLGGHPWTALPPRLARLQKLDYTVSTAKARASLSYEPMTDLREGIHQTVEWYSQFGLL